MGWGVLAVAAAAQAVAQEPPGDPSAQGVDTIPVDSAEPSPPSEATQLEDLVVTSTKRAVSVRDIPATVNALDGDALERLGAQGVDDFIKLVPGVNINDEGGNGPKRITVRGITGELQTVFATGVLFGDVPFSDLFIPFFHLDPNPFDLATVEVLKGPHGTLFGGYGLNGLIRYVPEPPKLATYELKYYVQHMAMEQGGRDPAYGAVLNAPLGGDTAALRLMAFRRDQPGYTDDTQAGVEDVNTLGQTGYRAMVAWEPAARWSVSLLHTAQDTHVADLASTDNFDGRLERGHTPRPSPTDTAYGLTSVALGYDFGWARVAGQASYVTKDFENFLDLSRIANDGQDAVLGNQYFVSSDAQVFELRLLSPEDAPGDWRWLVGAFGTPTDFYACFDTYTPAPPVPAGSPAPCPGTRDPAPYIAGQFLAYARTTDVAAFGEVTRRLGAHWDVTLGARWYETRLTGQVVTSGAAFEDGQPGPQERQPDLGESGVNPRLSVSWRPAPGLMAYASAARGFRFGGIQLAGDPLGNDLPDTYKSDVLWNYELGARTDWLGRTLQTDVAIYAIDWQDPQLLQRTPDGVFTYTDNVGGARGRGAELALRWRVPYVDGLLLNAQAAYNVTETTEPFTASSGAAVEPGSPWPYAPEWQTSTALSYTLSLGSWQGTFGVRHGYTSAAWNVVERTARVFDYQTWDAQLSVGSLARRWLPEISLIGSNLADERSFSGVTFFPNADPSVTYVAPRALVARLAAVF
jgi:iron complex outermembrane receptor protein